MAVTRRTRAHVTVFCAGLDLGLWCGARVGLEVCSVLTSRGVRKGRDSIVAIYGEGAFTVGDFPGRVRVDVVGTLDGCSSEACRDVAVILLALGGTYLSRWHEGYNLWSGESRGL